MSWRVGAHKHALQIRQVGAVLRQLLLALLDQLFALPFPQQLVGRLHRLLGAALLVAAPGLLGRRGPETLGRGLALGGPETLRDEGLLLSLAGLFLGFARCATPKP